MEGKGDVNYNPLEAEIPINKEEKPETYVIQIPRDQVYRIPPPEHAKIVESYTNPPPQQNNSFCNNFRWPILAIVTICIVFGIAFGISKLLFSPIPPVFRVARIRESNLQQKSPKIEISLIAQNPNNGIDIDYKESGDGVSLIFMHKTIATTTGGGKGFPNFIQDSKNSTTIPLILKGIKDKWSSEIKKSLHNPDTKAMRLKFDVSLTMDGLINKLSKHITVTCDFEVNSFETKGEINSSDCQTNF